MDIYEYWKDEIEPLRKDKYICPWCESRHSLAEWNRHTYLRGSDARPMTPQDFNERGRVYVSEVAYGRYCCPSCNYLSAGGRIRLAQD